MSVALLVNYTLLPSFLSVNDAALAVRLNLCFHNSEQDMSVQISALGYSLRNVWLTVSMLAGELGD